ncbi:MAG: hypothetical protein PHD72_00370 [Patescibacteria group bacterium]|nr:hypothetical protein [Patescibacteria group bacterium]
MDNNIWFYTLSTSAQVLAALAGLFAVFVVWKIQDINASLSEIRIAIIDLVYKAIRCTSGCEAIDPLVLSKFTNKELLKKFSELKNIRQLDPARSKAQFFPTQSKTQGFSYFLDDTSESLFREAIEKKSSVQLRLRWVVGASLFVIMVCIAALTFTNYIPRKELVLPLVELLVFYSLYALGVVIYDTVIE